jgi:hypothetical protein
LSTGYANELSSRHCLERARNLRWGTFFFGPDGGVDVRPRMTEPGARWNWTWPADQTLALTVGFVAMAVPSWYAGSAVFVGMSRTASANGKRDPISQVVFGWFDRIKKDQREDSR